MKILFVQIFSCEWLSAISLCFLVACLRSASEAVGEMLRCFFLSSCCAFGHCASVYSLLHGKPTPLPQKIWHAFSTQNSPSLAWDPEIFAILTSHSTSHMGGLKLQKWSVLIRFCYQRHHISNCPVFCCLSCFVFSSIFPNRSHLSLFYSICICESIWSIFSWKEREMWLWDLWLLYNKEVW